MRELFKLLEMDFEKYKKDAPLSMDKMAEMFDEMRSKMKEMVNTKRIHVSTTFRTITFDNTFNIKDIMKLLSILPMGEIGIPFKDKYPWKIKQKNDQKEKEIGSVLFKDIDKEKLEENMKAGIMNFVDISFKFKDGINPMEVFQ